MIEFNLRICLDKVKIITFCFTFLIAVTKQCSTDRKEIFYKIFQLVLHLLFLNAAKRNK